MGAKKTHLIAVPLAEDIRKTLVQRAPGEAIAQALEALLRFDAHLLRVDANERSLTHRVGMYLQEAFRAWDVDCEYNRKGGDPKRLELDDVRTNVTDTDGKTVYPDVIVHHRDTDDNHLVLEFKKTSSQVRDEIDFRKLHAFKHDPRLRYAFAIFIELRVGDDPGVARVVWVD